MTRVKNLNSSSYLESVDNPVEAKNQSPTKSVKIPAISVNLYGLIKLIAALLVVRQHTDFVYPDWPLPNFLLKNLPFLENLNLGFLLTGTNQSGTLAVVLFFQLSAFLIFKNFLSGKYQLTVSALTQFYFNRFKRLVPLYYFLTLIGLFLVFSDTLRQGNWLGLGGLLLFNYDHRVNFNYAYWTVGVEVVFYLVAPLMFQICCGANWLLSKFGSWFDSLRFLGSSPTNLPFSPNHHNLTSESQKFMQKNNLSFWSWGFLGINLWLLGIFYIWAIQRYWQPLIEHQFLQNLYNLRGLVEWLGVFISGLGLSLFLYFVNCSNQNLNLTPITFKEKHPKTDLKRLPNFKINLKKTTNSSSISLENLEELALFNLSSKLQKYLRWQKISRLGSYLGLVLVLLVLSLPLKDWQIDLSIGQIAVVLTTTWLIIWVELAENFSQKIQENLALIPTFSLEYFNCIKSTSKQNLSKQFKNKLITSSCSGLLAKLNSIKIFIVKILNQASKLSYGIFLTHVFILVRVNEIWRQNLEKILDPVHVGLVIWLIVSFLSLIISLFLYHSVEKPAASWLSSWQKRWASKKIS